jgi:hypothetical protein
MERRTGSFPGLVAFDICDIASVANGSFAWKWAVPSELTETINGVNTWCLRLHQWGGWLRLLDQYDENMRWEIEHHFVEPVAFYCMFQPRAVSERLLEVVENAIHQANCFVFPDEKDRLDQDALKPGQRLKVEKRKKQLDRIAARWLQYRPFRDLWTQIDSKSYRKLTHDFRNLSSHSIAPRFRFGETSRVQRSIVPTSNMVEQPDGTSLLLEDSTSLCFSYAFGVVMPLSFENAHAANLEQYELVRRTMRALDALIAELVGAINCRCAELQYQKARGDQSTNIGAP